MGCSGAVKGQGVGVEHQLSLKQRHGAALKSLLTGASVYIFVKFSVRTALKCFLFSGERAQRDFTLFFFFFFKSTMLT